MRRRALLFTVLALTGSLFLETAAVRADISKSTKTKHDVTQYLTVAFDFKYCGDGDDYAAYKMHTVSRRWQRYKRRREVSRASGLWGAYAWTCGMNRYDEQHEFNFDPCFGCDGYSKAWTPDIQGSTGYPYLLETDTNCDDPECNSPVTEWKLGVHMRGYIRNQDGRLLGSICTRIQLIGTLRCSPE
jgi:hypothetical protein